jgi:branched-chain amino acid transport system permease protein
MDVLKQLERVAGGTGRGAQQMRWAWVGVAAIALTTLYFTQLQSDLNIYLLNTVMLASIGAVALNMLMGTAGQPSIGNAAFLAIGSFSAVVFIRTGWFDFPFDIVAATLVAALAGLIVGLPALRLSGLHLILATLAAHFIVLFFVGRYQRETVGESGFVIVPAFAGNGLRHAQFVWAWLLAALLSIVVLLMSRLVAERSGRAWRLIRDNELIAPTFGIRPTRYKLIAFSLSSGLIGMQGALLLHFNGSATIDSFTLLLAIQYLAMILIGGLDSILGAVIGAALLTYLPTKVPELVAHFVNSNDAAIKGPQISTIIYGILIILVVTLSPRGIVGWLTSTNTSFVNRRRRGRSLRSRDAAGTTSANSRDI